MLTAFAVDTDTDGLPDAYETAIGLDPGNAADVTETELAAYYTGEDNETFDPGAAVWYDAGATISKYYATDKVIGGSAPAMNHK